jgi:hypothetical protein
MLLKGYVEAPVSNVGALHPPPSRAGREEIDGVRPADRRVHDERARAGGDGRDALRRERAPPRTHDLDPREVARHEHEARVGAASEPFAVEEHPARVAARRDAHVLPGGAESVEGRRDVLRDRARRGRDAVDVPIECIIHMPPGERGWHGIDDLGVRGVRQTARVPRGLAAGFGRRRPRNVGVFVEDDIHGRGGLQGGGLDVVDARHVAGEQGRESPHPRPCRAQGETSHDPRKIPRGHSLLQGALALFPSPARRRRAAPPRTPCARHRHDANPLRAAGTLARRDATRRDAEERLARRAK